MHAISYDSQTVMYILYIYIYMTYMYMCSYACMCVCVHVLGRRVYAHACLLRQCVCMFIHGLEAYTLAYIELCSLSLIHI